MNPKYLLSFLMLMVGFVGFVSAENQAINLPSDDTQIEISFDVSKTFQSIQPTKEPSAMFVNDVGHIDSPGQIQTVNRKPSKHFVKYRQREYQDSEEPDEVDQHPDKYSLSHYRNWRIDRQGFNGNSASWIFCSLGKRMRC